MILSAWKVPGVSSVEFAKTAVVRTTPVTPSPATKAKPAAMEFVTANPKQTNAKMSPSPVMQVLQMSPPPRMVTLQRKPRETKAARTRLTELISPAAAVSVILRAQALRPSG